MVIWTHHDDCPYICRVETQRQDVAYARASSWRPELLLLPPLNFDAARPKFGWRMEVAACCMPAVRSSRACDTKSGIGVRARTIGLWLTCRGDWILWRSRFAPRFHLSICAILSSHHPPRHILLESMCGSSAVREKRTIALSHCFQIWRKPRPISKYCNPVQ